ncbi:MAG TPA: hypothetical protein EYP41_20210 [Anaerolineae bacterium]|nr:hypothetical protein [Anaerolineae bacterium]HIP73414.1 hypothetical protein [Anaerolineae bacterium]
MGEFVMETAVSNTITLREHKQKESVPLTQAQAMQLKEHYSKFISVERSWGEGWTLTAKQYVGTIVLDDLRIVIRPKILLDNLFYMLTYAYDLPSFRNEITTLGEADDLFEFITVIFANQVGQLVRRGLYRSYLEQEENRRFLRGKLLVAEQIRRNSVRVTHVYQQNCEFTADILENQILKYILWQLSRLTFRTPHLRQRLRRLMSAFGETSLRMVRPWDCEQVIYTRLNGAYRNPLHLAQLLLQNLSLENQVGNTFFPAFLFDMNNVFELFVARYLKQYLAENHSDFGIEIQPKIWLGLEVKERGIPDIVLQHHGRRFMVLDTKYKGFTGMPSINDRNQMYMYCRSMGLTHGCLIYPEEADYQNTFPDVKLRGVGLSLNGELAVFQEHCQQFGQQFIDLAADVVSTPAQF